jgi:hypothetical protein
MRLPAGGPALAWTGPFPYRVFRIIFFRMILTLTSRITTISGKKMRCFSTSFSPLVSRRGHSRRLFHF